MRDREKILIQTRHTNMMKNNLEKVGHIENLEKWVRRGFSTSHSTKKTINLAASPQLEKLSRIAQSPIRITPARTGDEWKSSMKVFCSFTFNRLEM